MNARAWIKLGGLGAAGLIVAAVLAALALRLVSQPIGLSSEPVTAGDRLVPRDSRAGASEATSATSASGDSRGSRRAGARPTTRTRPKQDDESGANPVEPGDTPARESLPREDASGEEEHDDHGGEEDHDD